MTCPAWSTWLVLSILPIVRPGCWSTSVVTEDEPGSCEDTVKLHVLTRLVPPPLPPYVTPWMQCTTYAAPPARLAPLSLRVALPIFTVTPVRSMLPVLLTVTV